MTFGYDRDNKKKLFNGNNAPSLAKSKEDVLSVEGVWYSSCMLPARSDL